MINLHNGRKSRSGLRIINFTDTIDILCYKMFCLTLKLFICFTIFKHFLTFNIGVILYVDLNLALIYLVEI